MESMGKWKLCVEYTEKMSLINGGSSPELNNYRNLVSRIKLGLEDVLIACPPSVETIKIVDTRNGLR
jgi:hypothetical protein